MKSTFFWIGPALSVWTSGYLCGMVEVICIDDKNKPEAIPERFWIKEGEKVPLTLTFADKWGKKTTQEITATVRALASAQHKH